MVGEIPRRWVLWHLQFEVAEFKAFSGSLDLLSPFFRRIFF